MSFTDFKDKYAQPDAEFKRQLVIETIRRCATLWCPDGCGTLDPDIADPRPWPLAKVGGEWVHVRQSEPMALNERCRAQALWDAYPQYALGPWPPWMAHYTRPQSEIKEETP